MLNFSKEQTRFEIAGLKIGGQPGELPRVLFGTVFYRKQFSDVDASAIKRVQELVSAQEEMTGITGVPAVVDIFIDDEDDLATRIDTVADMVSGPISVDIPDPDLKVKVLEHLDAGGLLERTIYNSINLGLTPEELDALLEHTPASAIVLAFNPKDMSTDGKIDILETGAGFTEKGLMEIASDCGIKAQLLDTAATPFEHMAAEPIRSIPVMKNRWGLPTGCAIHNTVESWLWMKDNRKEYKEQYTINDIGSLGLPAIMGADYLVYGPIDNAPRAFPFIAMVDKFLAEGASDYFGISQDDDHPRGLMP